MGCSHSCDTLLTEKRNNKPENKTLSAVWSDGMQQQMKTPKLGVIDLSIQIAMQYVRITRRFPFQKTCMLLATIAAVGHSTKSVRSLARDLNSGGYPNKIVPLPRTPTPLSLQLQLAEIPLRPRPGSC